MAAKSSGVIAGDTDLIISPSPCQFVGISFHDDKTNEVLVVLYDDASGTSGTVIYDGYIKALAETNVSYTPSVPIACSKGIFAAITKVAGMVVHFIPGRS